MIDNKNIIKFTKIAIVGIIISIVAIFVILGYNAESFKSTNHQIILEVKKGEGLYHLTQRLYSNKLIYSKKVFKVKALLMGLDKSLKPGEYILNSNMGDTEILNRISKGQVFYRKITIPEGLTVKEITNIVNSNEYLKDEITIDFKEGYLLPETYYFRKGDTRDSVISQMQVAMDNNLNMIWQNRNINKLRGYIKTKDDLVNLASIMEKEALLESEKRQIAAVYLNRLKKGMRLQADPTVIYGAKNYKGDITYKMLKEKTPYNTYKIKGLPKTPIANPDLMSLKAVANPADVDYLYFVADGKGGHVFSKTYSQHRENVKKYLKLNRKKRS